MEYFNKRFQFYNRNIELVIYDGKGDPLSEIIGQGQEGAKADALKVAKEHKAFADVSAVTVPYAAGLSAEGVINIGAPYVPRNWLAQRRPYSWTPLTDCSTVVESAASYYAVKMAKKPAKNASGALKDKPRRLAVIAPDNAEYQACVDAGIGLLNKMGRRRRPCRPSQVPDQHEPGRGGEQHPAQVAQRQHHDAHVRL
ncbi:MAG: hypothetical protein M5U19_14690 [Microthrixaceae bacterium]|nr:hypothetical protein [Microthrixaceae bacterium]